MAIITRCIFCARDLANDSYKYCLDALSAAQGAGENRIAVCASCNFFFDGSVEGITSDMDPYCILGTGNGPDMMQPFMDLPKDKMLYALASACSGGDKCALSSWFPSIINWLSGSTYITQK